MGRERSISDFMKRHYRHFNAAVVVEAADFTQMLQQAIHESRAAGLDLRDLEQTAGGVYTTSSEYLGEIGAAIARFLQSNGHNVPPATAAKFRGCLAEVGKVWPK